MDDGVTPSVGEFTLHFTSALEPVEPNANTHDGTRKSTAANVKDIREPLRRRARQTPTPNALP
jgi:hypothetical protein